MLLWNVRNISNYCDFFSSYFSNFSLLESRPKVPAVGIAHGVPSPALTILAFTFLGKKNVELPGLAMPHPRTISTFSLEILFELYPTSVSLFHRGVA